MKTKIKQLTLVAGAVVLGAFFTFSVFTANAESNTNNDDQTSISMQMDQSSVSDIYTIGDEGKCGEGKCGEGKCGEGKKSEKKSAKKSEKKSEKKKESKKAEKKKAEKKKAEKKKAESKCGEGKCG